MLSLFLLLPRSITNCDPARDPVRYSDLDPEPHPNPNPNPDRDANPNPKPQKLDLTLALTHAPTLTLMVTPTPEVMRGAAWGGGQVMRAGCMHAGLCTSWKLGFGLKCKHDSCE